MIRNMLFDQLISLLKQTDIIYAIVGRTEEYPENIGSDVDIIIPLNQIEKFHSMIWKMENDSTKVIQMFQHEIVAFYYIIMDITSDKVIYIQPDVCTDYYRKGRKLLSASELLEGSQSAVDGNGESKGFNILSYRKEFIYYLLKKIDKQNINLEQFTHIYNCYLKDSKGSIEEATNFWSDRELQLLQTIFEQNNFSLLQQNIKNFQKSIHSHSRVNLSTKFRNIFLKVKRILYPTGYVIAVLGPDGSGKTTVMNQFKQDIKPAFRKLQQFHLFPKPQKDSYINSDPHGKKSRNFISSILKLLYFVILYNRGFIKYVYPAKIRSTLTIFDRYYDDILIDPYRYRNGTSEFWVKLIGKLIPQPQFWIILDAPTEVIQKRKAEVSPEETERQRQAYIKFAKSKKNALLINTDRDVKEISFDICSRMAQLLNERAKNRYKK